MLFWRFRIQFDKGGPLKRNTAKRIRKELELPKEGVGRQLKRSDRTLFRRGWMTWKCYVCNFPNDSNADCCSTLEMLYFEINDQRHIHSRGTGSRR
eukprot:g15596.t1